MSDSSIVVAAVSAAVKYIKTDLGRRYGLEKEAHCTIRGEGVGIGSASAGPLRIESEKGGNRVRLTASPFAADTGYWNGPNVIPDNLGDGSLEASLWHDLIWTFCDELAAQLGMTRAQLLAWSNGVLAAAWRGYGARRGRSPRILPYLGYNLCRFGAWLKDRIFKFFCIGVATLFLTGCTGCETPPPWELGDAGEVDVLYASARATLQEVPGHG